MFLQEKIQYQRVMKMKAMQAFKLILKMKKKKLQMLIPLKMLNIKTVAVITNHKQIKLSRAD